MHAAPPSQTLAIYEDVTSVEREEKVTMASVSLMCGFVLPCRKTDTMFYCIGRRISNVMSHSDTFQYEINFISEHLYSRPIATYVGHADGCIYLSMRLILPLTNRQFPHANRCKTQSEAPVAAP